MSPVLPGRLSAVAGKYSAGAGSVEPAGDFFGELLHEIWCLLGAGTAGGSGQRGELAFAECELRAEHATIDDAGFVPDAADVLHLAERAHGFRHGFDVGFGIGGRRVVPHPENHEASADTAVRGFPPAFKGAVR